MRRRPLDLALLAILGGAWLACVAVHVALLADARIAWVPVTIEPARSADVFPTLAGIWPGSESGALAPGDRLLAMGDETLAGAGPVDLIARAYRAAERPGPGDPPDAARSDAPEVLVTYARGSRIDETRLALTRPQPAWRNLPLVVGLGVCACIALWRGRGRRSARAFALAAFAYAFHKSMLLGGPEPVTWAGMALLVVGGSLFMPLTLRAILLFPEQGRPGVVARLAPWGFATAGLGLASWVLGVPFDTRTGFLLFFATQLLFLLIALGLIARMYVGSDDGVRRQLRWVLTGAYLAFAPVLAGSAVVALRPVLWWVYEWSLLAMAVFPAAVAIAIMRSNLFDIDRVISASAAFTLLSIALVAGLFTVVPMVSELASQQAGLDASAVQTVLGIGMAVLLVPGARVVQPRVERVFFRERFRLEGGLRALRRELGRADGPGPLFEGLGNGLLELIEPDACVVYARSGEVFATVFAAGPIVPSGFDVESPLVGLLEEAATPVDARRWRRWVRSRLLGEVERALLESLGAELVVPVIQSDELVALICLAEKRSGDVYTPTDQAHLDTLADRVALELGRYARDRVEREQLARYEEIAGYVPAAVREGVLEGAAFEPGVREVSVLFVDIRGYTAFSEGREASEIFQVVSTYTESVSRDIRAHEGTVVEFHGDGLLAVFGAPAPDPEKERHAVEAALRIVETIAEQCFEVEGQVELEVGVGIATGDAYLGNVRSIDRKIWNVIGNTVNLAARLEGLTRSIGCAVVVDAVTQAAAGKPASDFEAREDVRVKGRSEAMTVFCHGRLTPAG